jgi:lysophospholipase L1-like esterase
MEGTGKERTATLSVPDGTDVRFKVTEGSWFRQAVDEACNPFPDASVIVREDTTHRLTVPRFRGPAEECPWPDPLRWEDDIVAFETVDKKVPVPSGLLLAVGSSTMVGWHATIQKDLAPLKVVPRGFGGSNMNDLVHYIPRVVFPYKPSAILVYQGDNDLAAGIHAATVVKKFREFIWRVGQELPEVPILFLAVKPSESRWDLRPAQQEVNAGLQALAAEYPHVKFIDIATPLLGTDGKPRAELFQGDKLHLNAAGYEVLTEAVRPHLPPQAPVKR